MSGRSYPKYDAYMSSGVEWMGEVPEHWKSVRLAFLFSHTNAGEVIDKGYWGKGNELLFTCAREPLISDFPEFPDDRRTSKQDLLLTRNGTPYVHTPPPGSIYTNVVQRITLLPGYHRGFLSHALGAACLSLRGYGVSIESLNFGMWKSLAISIPPLPEQEAIARFLDHKTGQIDALIAKKEALLAKLAQKRTALISRAVTKGLDPSVPMKESGIEWLGEIPAHWEVISLRHLSTIGNGSTPSRSNADYWNEGAFPWLNSSVVHQRIVSEAQQFVTPLALRECHLPIVTPQSVLLAITGQGKTRGTAALLTFEATINQHLVFIYPEQSVLTSHYLFMLLTGMYSYLRYISDDAGGTRGALTIDDLKGLKIPVPPVGEQRTISQFVEKETELVDRQSEKIQAAIDKLKQYRSALITAAVTGKIDVRNAAPIP